MTSQLGPSVLPGEPGWAHLRMLAEDVRRHAYAPYSGYAVGAAGLTGTGRVVTGCNVENASYGTTLCAECGLVGMLHATGGGSLTALVCVGGPATAAGEVITPCGRCRQLLQEHGGSGLRLLTPQGPGTLGDLLPQPFDRASLMAGATPPADERGGRLPGGTGEPR